MFYEKIKKFATPKKLLVFFIVFVIYYIIPIKPGFSVTDWETEAGITLMDFNFGGYGANEVFNVLNAIGTEGRSIYKSLIIRDYIMGVLYSFVLICLLGCLIKRHINNGNHSNILLLFPLIATLSDWTENSITFWFIENYPVITPTLAKIESIATTMKFSFLALSVICAITIFVYGIVKHHIITKIK